MNVQRIVGKFNQENVDAISQTSTAIVMEFLIAWIHALIAWIATVMAFKIVSMSAHMTLRKRNSGYVVATYWISTATVTVLQIATTFAPTTQAKCTQGCVVAI